ncbi:hypothetical protein HMPREF9057_00754 [Actinomyces sp. oral taxon 171 str. F0337]|nr:hypothetical protein HMPREF9057_00754 [Actinomyces sp. oral taxon 171 str. F0337]
MTRTAAVRTRPSTTTRIPHGEGTSSSSDGARAPARSAPEPADQITAVTHDAIQA